MPALAPAVVLAGACTVAVAAQDLPGDAGAGRRFAEAQCADCHLIAGHEVMPLVPGDPPSFQAVADDPAVTELALRVFLQTPHPTMPNLRLTEDEIADVIAYILSLQ